MTLLMVCDPTPISKYGFQINCFHFRRVVMTLKGVVWPLYPPNVHRTAPNIITFQACAAQC